MKSVHGARRRSLLGSLVVLALLAFAVFIPSFAQAAVPANDEIGAATAIGSLPFTDTLDTTEATTAADDPQCAGNGQTVWYTFTPSADIRLDANTFGSSYDTTISVYTGSPGALTQIACNDDSAGLQSQVIFDATGGQTYYIMAGSFFSASGGSLTLTLRQPPPPPEVGVPTTSLRNPTVSVSRRRGQRRAAARARGGGPRQALEPRVPARLGRRRGSQVPRGLRRLGTCGRERALSALQRLPAQSSSG